MRPEIGRRVKTILSIKNKSYRTHTEKRRKKPSAILRPNHAEMRHYITKNPKTFLVITRLRSFQSKRIGVKGHMQLFSS